MKSTEKRVKHGVVPTQNKARLSFQGVSRPFSETPFDIMGVMRTYHCHKCDRKFRLDPKDVSASNPQAWCYCTPVTPTRLSDRSRKELDKKYDGIFTHH